MRIEPVPFESLGSFAILEDPRGSQAESEEMTIGSSVVRVGRAPRVLYIPELGLQLAGGSVPEESLVDDWVSTTGEQSVSPGLLLELPEWVRTFALGRARREQTERCET